MRISHKNNFIYISTPKTGSTSVRRALEPHSDIIAKSHLGPYAHHGTARDLRKHFAEMFQTLHNGKKATLPDPKRWDWESYIKFTTVRNPWDRLVSLFFGHVPNTSRFGIGKFVKKAVLREFKDFLVKDGDLVKAHSSYKKWYEGENGEILIDYFIKLENLKKDFDNICDKIGISRQELPHIMRSDHTFYADYYDDETREIVAQKYAEDIERFGYKFGE